MTLASIVLVISTCFSGGDSWQQLAGRDDELEQNDEDDGADPVETPIGSMTPTVLAGAHSGELA